MARSLAKLLIQYLNMQMIKVFSDHLISLSSEKKISGEIWTYGKEKRRQIKYL